MVRGRPEDRRAMPQRNPKKSAATASDKDGRPAKKPNEGSPD